MLHEEPYLKISPDVVDPANEGRRVQLTAPAYTDEWLELPDIGVRCQALRLETVAFLCFGEVHDAC